MIVCNINLHPDVAIHMVSTALRNIVVKLLSSPYACIIITQDSNSREEGSRTYNTIM